MKDNHPSDTFIKLYNDIIVELLSQVCNKLDYCIEPQINGNFLPTAMWKVYQKYETEALNNMSSDRLDRHKLASCICGTIIKLRPVVSINETSGYKSVNEYVALYVALSVIKAFMMEDVVRENEKSIITPEIKNEIKTYIKNNFSMSLPPLDKNIRDAQSYEKNMINALYWCHRICPTIKTKECFQYDIWAYSKIFYHLEIYNKPFLEKCWQNYLEQHSL